MSARYSPAAATGTLSCAIEDRNLAFELLANTSIDDGGIVAVQHGKLTLKAGRSVKSASTLALSRDAIYQQWDFDNELRFAVRLEEPRRGRTVFLAIMTVRNEKLEQYVGRYVLKLIGAGAPEVRKGPASCEGD